MDDRDYSRKPIERFRITSAAGWTSSPFHGSRFFFLIWLILFFLLFDISFSPITSNPINRLLFPRTYHRITKKKEASQWNADEFLAPSTGRCWARVRRIDLVIKYHHVSFRCCLFSWSSILLYIQLLLVFRLPTDDVKKHIKSIQ